ncbi:MAG: gas vesicle protein GvpG [Chloroflexi bacterium]|nr:gas vesicle protein GvpG [Chloroflexota bacterium]
MGLFRNLLMLPMLGAPQMVHWLAGTLAEEAERRALDDVSVRGELLELQRQYDAGEMEEAEYDRQERTLLERLSAIREAKAQRS